LINDYESNIDVVTMARRRVKHIFDTAGKIFFSTSGGKDSICLNDIMFGLCQSGEVDKSKLTVMFVDEEAIYPCIEETVKKMRLQWMSIGVPFEWYCIQVKHFNCLNSLSQDESFICWDENKKDVWIRDMPSFAITSDPFLNERHETYQSWSHKKTKGGVLVTGVRMYESIQRRQYLSAMVDQSKQYPIYDWRDRDVWKYILDNGLEIPDAYVYMYQCGVHKNRMRISQFFSVDTIGSLVNMCEFYPNLFDKICKREPNAYMAMLYYDTEMFRRAKGKNSKTKDGQEIDWEEKTKKLLSETWRFESDVKRYTRDRCLKILLKFGAYMNNNHWKEAYEALVAGDPKGRAVRALEMHAYENLHRESGSYGGRH
jgi:predicted phosphoadenosine phosphosulfate sulfurtransferase